MQALTLSIGQAGISFFSQQLFSSQLASLLAGLAFPDTTIPIANFTATGFGWSDEYSNLNVYLTCGTMQDFTPQYQGVTQLMSGNPPGSEFQLVFSAGQFSVQYTWNETGSDYSCVSGGENGPVCNVNNVDNTFTYTPQFSSISVQVTAAFTYDADVNSYQFNGVGSPLATAVEKSANIPSRSVLQSEDSSCFSSHVSSTTSTAVSAIDFTSPVAAALPAMLATLPASGDLGNGIVFDFGMGDSGMTFSTVNGQNGLSIGVTGSVSYNGTPYPGASPNALPIPPVPVSTSPDHLQAYVSDYSINGLQWAYFTAGLLTTTATPATIPDPEALKCVTYVGYIPAFRPYVLYGMQADITPLSAPVTTFQQVWYLSNAALNALESQLPTTVWNILNDTVLIGSTYLSSASLESALTTCGVPSEYFAVVENATACMGMVAVHDLQFVLTIMNGATTQPTITFSVQRTDIQTSLALGIANIANSRAQTLQFSYVNNVSAVTFVSSTVPDFPNSLDFSNIWGMVELQYDKVLDDMGSAGVPIPMMSGLSFLFGDAQLSVQQGYVSIQAQVEAS